MKINRLYLFIILSLVTILASHPLQGWINIDVKYIFIPTILIVLFIGVHINSFSLNFKKIMWILCMLLLGLIGSVVSGSSMQILVLGIASILFIVANGSYPLINTIAAADFLCNIVIFILVGAWVGFVYALFGGVATLEVTNLETSKPIALYLTTFTNSIILNVIRPSGLFDEPGALAMYLILATCINETIGGKRWKSVLILLLGIVTFSLMQFIIIIIFSFVVLGKEFRRHRAALMMIVVVIFGGVNFGGEVVEDLFTSRFVVNDNQLAGDNRSRQVELFFEKLDVEIFFKGSSIHGQKNNIGEDLSSNPFTLLWESGIFVWLPYLFWILWLIYIGLRTTGSLRFAAFSVMLLLLQRPYVFSLYWGLLINYTLLILIHGYNAVRMGKTR